MDNNIDNLLHNRSANIDNQCLLLVKAKVLESDFAVIKLRTNQKKRHKHGSVFKLIEEWERCDPAVLRAIGCA
jgi:hypothetical protein